MRALCVCVARLRRGVLAGQRLLLRRAAPVRIGRKAGLADGRVNVPASGWENAVEVPGARTTVRVTVCVMLARNVRTGPSEMSRDKLIP